MSRTRFPLLLILGCLLGVGALATPSTADEGASKPDFALPDADGTTRRLSDYRGKWVVLEWVNFDCGPVKELYQAPGRRMQALQKTYRAKGVVWLSINSAAVGKRGHLTGPQSKAVLARLGASPTAMLLDTAGKVGRAFGAKLTPEVRVISPQGDVAYAGGVEGAGQGGPVSYLEPVLSAATSGRALPFKAKSMRGCRINYSNVVPASPAGTTPARPAATGGPKAPDFTLVDSTGVTRRLSDYRGKWVVLELSLIHI